MLDGVMDSNFERIVLLQVVLLQVVGLQLVLLFVLLFTSLEPALAIDEMERRKAVVLGG